jgi:hypothetical protein
MGEQRAVAHRGRFVAGREVDAGQHARPEQGERIPVATAGGQHITGAGLAGPPPQGLRVSWDRWGPSSLVVWQY